jgi:hypothetical protein
MPVAPTSGVPPLSTLKQVDVVQADMRVTSFAPYYPDSSLADRNFFEQNEQVVLGAIVILFLITTFILTSVVGF